MIFLTHRHLMCSGKRSPGIRRGLFLTCDKTPDGGKGEPSKTGEKKVFSAGGINLARLRAERGIFV